MVAFDFKNVVPARAIILEQSVRKIASAFRWEFLPVKKVSNDTVPRGVSYFMGWTTWAGTGVGSSRSDVLPRGNRGVAVARWNLISRSLTDCERSRC